MSADTQEAKVILSLSDTVGPTKPNILGQNMTMRQGGPWGHICNERTGEVYPDVVKALKELRPTSLRYPSGLEGDFTHWNEMIGPREQRKKQSTNGEMEDQFPYLGVDEFLRLTEEVEGCQPLLIVNISKSSRWKDGTAKEAAAWVAYCNATEDNTLLLGVDETGRDWKTAGYWAAQRAKNGHPKPYRVKYWELGNELNQDGGPVFKWQEYLLTAEEYLKRSDEFIRLMREVDKDIKIGLHGYTEGSCKPEDNPVGFKGGGPWMPTVLKGLNGKFDFFVWHHYNTFTLDAVPNKDRDAFCKAVLGWTSVHYDPALKRVKTWLKDMAPSSEIWLTEYYRFDGIVRDESRGRNLIVALGNADFLMQNMMSVDLDAAQYFGFNSGGDGTIFPGNDKVYFGKKIPSGVVVRFPVHWVFTMFGSSVFRDAGGTILKPTVECRQYEVMGYHAPVVRVVAAVNKNASRMDIFLLNKSLGAKVNVEIQIGGIKKKIKAVRATEFNSWKKDSEYPPFDENELTIQNVYSKEISPPTVAGEKISGTLPPHSLTMYSCELE